MNNGRMWTVLSPNVGVPIFFAALVITSLTIHYHLLTKTTYFTDFLRGTSAAVSVVNGDVDTMAKATIPEKVD